MKNYALPLSDAISLFKIAFQAESDSDDDAKSADLEFEQFIWQVRQQFEKQRDETFHNLDLLAGVIGGTLLAILVGAAHEYGNKNVAMENVLLSLNSYLGAETLRQYALINAYSFVAFFAFQIIGLITRYLINSGDLKNFDKAHENYKKERNKLEFISKLQYINTAGFWYKNSRRFFMLSYIPWAIGLFLFISGFIDYAAHWVSHH